MKDCKNDRLITDSEIEKLNMGMISLKHFKKICKRRHEADVNQIKTYIISLGLGVETDEKSLFIPSLVQDFKEVRQVYSLASII